MQPLFSAGDLQDLLGQEVSSARAVAVERIVWGWLRPVLGLDERPDPISAEVFAWAIELGAIAYENPSGLADYQNGDVRAGFSFERRAQILADAAEAEGGSGGPLGSFPPAQAWPDPIAPGYSRTW